MSKFRLPNGATVAIESGRAAAKDISAFSNADPGVMTLEASHGVATGELFVCYNSWSKTNGRVFKAGTVATNAVPVVDLDTLSTTLFPSGSGIGTVQEISGWTQIVGVVNPTTEGGEQQYATVQALEDDVQTRLPTVKTPYGLNFQVADDTTLAWYALAKAASDSGDDIAIKVTLKNGNILLYNGILTLTETPSLAINEAMLLSVTMSLQGQPTRYTS